MGSVSAASMRADLADEAALEWHLQYNHYPPIPLRMVAVAQEAIAAVASSCPDTPCTDMVQLPEDCTFRGENEAPAWEVMEAMHLWDFIDTEDAEEL